MEQNTIYLTIFGSAAVTALCRLIPILILGDRDPSPRVKDFLHFCPIAILCSMIGPEILFRDQRIDLSFSNQFFWIFFPCVLVAIKSKNIAITVLVSISLLAIWRLI